MSVNILAPGYDWTDRETGAVVAKPINYDITSFSNTPGIRTYIDGGGELAGKTFGGVDITLRVAMADPVEFVTLTLTEYGGYNMATVDVPYTGQEGDQYVYQLDGVVQFDDDVLVEVGPSADVSVEIATSAYPSPAIAPLNFLMTYIALEEGGAPPSTCFWTDLVGVTQDCADAPQPDAVTPIREYQAGGDNGVTQVYWANPNDSYQGEPWVITEDYCGLYLSGGDWRILAAPESYFPDSDNDTAEVTLTLYRAPRNTTSAVFAGQEPWNFEMWAEYVGQVTESGLTVENSNNGNIRDRITGIITGMPTIDPDYAYFVTAAVNIYSPEAVLVSTQNLAGGVYDPAGELPDADGVVKPIKMSLPITPVEFDGYTVNIQGMGMAMVWAVTDAVVFYSTATWRGLDGFQCSAYEASIDGEPNVTIMAQCS